jgi:3-(3-hydroxy-phenyl)propionate hydroxylase
MNGGIHDGFNIAQKLSTVIQNQSAPAELDRYERQRRPVALEYVNRITIANKRNLEARDPEEHRRWKEEMTRTAADPRLAREYMLKISMIASLRSSECA